MKHLRNMCALEARGRYQLAVFRDRKPSSAVSRISPDSRAVIACSHVSAELCVLYSIACINQGEIHFSAQNSGLLAVQGFAPLAT